ncbi:uncharacterized protein LOC105435551 isoform X2 [Cucumis sativus]|nr:uncharacterized protein LOC105435551 isoform X2 [Cucumis sativus]
MRKLDTMIEVVKRVKELGIEPKATMFLHALRVRSSMNDSTWEKKINVLKSLGWSEKEILTAFKKCPLYLIRSEEKMRVVADFCFNTAKLDPEVVIFYPKLFMCALDNRLRRRYKVLEVLKAKNLLKSKKIAWMLLVAEKRFVEICVLKHLDEIPNLMDVYRGNVAAETSSVQ